MKPKWKISFFGSSLLSAYWNGAATYYRGIIRNLHERGHIVTFFEPDAYERQKHRDISDPPYAKVVVYEPTEEGVNLALEAASDADILIKASGVGMLDQELEQWILEMKTPTRRVIFWDVDAPATLERVLEDPTDRFRWLIPFYDMILTYGGGESVIRAYKTLGAKQCIPIYNALDPTTHHRSQPQIRFQASLGFLGNRMPDRESRVEEFFLKPAMLAPEHTFLLGGSGWTDKSIPSNVRYIGHVYSNDHNAFNSSAHAVLNVNRESMARFGFSPPTRIFEAAGAGSTIISDAWDGIDEFLEPEQEVLIARNGDEVAKHLRELTPQRSHAIGTAALKRVLSKHTYAHRAEQFETLMKEDGVLTA